jgi:catechol 2,3-dioxygenase-like lactoylglutathione lyase family enzyme
VEAGRGRLGVPTHDYDPRQPTHDREEGAGAHREGPRRPRRGRHQGDTSLVRAAPPASPDDVPRAEAAEWHVTETGSIQLVQSAERAGNGLVTLSVDDVDELVAALEGRDLELAAANTPSGMFRIASITDPDGNVITLAEDLRRT